jgi:hypothetical protein
MNNSPRVGVVIALKRKEREARRSEEAKAPASPAPVVEAAPAQAQQVEHDPAWLELWHRFG